MPVLWLSVFAAGAVKYCTKQHLWHYMRMIIYVGLLVTVDQLLTHTANKVAFYAHAYCGCS